jgi:predicted nucleic acid-binding Zn finger protein
MDKEKSETEAYSTLKRDLTEKKITNEEIAHLKAVFGPRFLKAWDCIEDGRVKKYTFTPSGKIVWVVVGRERDYLVMPIAEFCSCDDFFFNVMEKKTPFCYQLIAQRLAESFKRYDEIEEEDDWYDILMKEWRKVTI